MLYNIIIVFIVITFAFLAGIMSYSKAFKVNGRIINSLEKYEGYNDFAADEIDKTLQTIGYRFMATSDKNQCGSKSGAKTIPLIYKNGVKYNYCVYQFQSKENPKYFYYGVKSYIYLDLPVIGKLLKIPIYTTTDTIYCFTHDSNNKECQYRK